MRLAIVLVLAAACRSDKPPDPGPDLMIVGESTRVRLEDPFPATTPWFDGREVTLVGAKGETLGIQVLQRHPQPVTLELAGAKGFEVRSFRVTRPSTALFGGSRGKGTYADELIASARPATSPAYFEIVVDAAATGTLVVGDRRIPVKLAVADVTLPPLPRTVWAYEDPRELAWHAGAPPDGARVTQPSEAERACIAMFRAHGVLLAPDLPLSAWPVYQPLLDGFPHIPAAISDDPAKVGEDVRGWIEATRGTGAIPFAIPIDEPRTPAARANVKALAAAVRAAGGGPTTFRYAVTDAPRAEYGDLVDLYISWNAAHLTGDTHPRWTYNGAPPYAGAVTLDALTPGTRTWGWIAHRYNIPVWYVWDALYWHDRHNRKGAPLPGRALDVTKDPVSFDDGEDRGNLDGVLALPGCTRTLRLAALRRGLQDRQLLELAAKCAPAETAQLAAELVPRALGDAKGKSPSWPTDEGAWEQARRHLLELAACP
ncbi:MAG: hypothetical protein M4D80_14115 [Myxococcota bacterium]|nr:hypothetical protein [Myxococcota bacterium]